MNILYDGQVFSFQRVGGISRYFAELISHIKSDRTDLGVLVSNNQYLRDLGISYYDITRLWNFKGRMKLIQKVNNLYGLHLLSKANVFHPTYYDTYFLNKRKFGIPYVITIHDMIHERFPNYFSSKDTVSERKKLLALNADAIIAVSYSTKSDILERFNVPEEKVSIVYHGYNNLDVFLSNELKFELNFEFILFVGEREGYKNFRNFIEAFALLTVKHSDLKLICVGKPFTRDEKELFSFLNVFSKVVQLNATDAELAHLYAKALFFVYPSIAEGFGIPLLEAMGCGCAMLASDSTCFQEIAGDCAIYFDPYNKFSMFEKMDWALRNKANLSELIVKGKLRVKQFTWKKCANETLKVYSSIV